VKLKMASYEKLDWGAYSDIKAWILSLGAMCAVPDSLDESWFVRNLGGLLLFDVGSDDCSEDAILGRLKELQLRYYYHEAVYGPWAERLAKKLALLVNTPLPIVPG
jgi:hypothetical protein